MSGKETLEEAAERVFTKEKYPTSFETLRKAFISNVKWQQERMYSDIDEAIWLLKQTTEYEVLESFKGKVRELEKYKNK